MFYMTFVTVLSALRGDRLYTKGEIEKSISSVSSDGLKIIICVIFLANELISQMSGQNDCLLSKNRNTEDGFLKNLYPK